MRLVVGPWQRRASPGRSGSRARTWPPAGRDAGARSSTIDGQHGRQHIAAPIRGELTDTRLPMSPSRTCQACVDRPVRPDQKGSMRRSARLSSALSPAIAPRAVRHRCRRHGRRSRRASLRCRAARIGRGSSQGACRRRSDRTALVSSPTRMRCSRSRARPLQPPPAELLARFGGGPRTFSPRAPPPIWYPKRTWLPSGRSGRCWRAGGPMTRSSARREERLARASSAGSSTRSTGPSTSCSGSRCLPSASPARRAGETLAGVVLDPIRDERFAAIRSGAAIAQRR